MALSKINNDTTGVSKWQAALALVGVAACSAGFYYYFLKNNLPKKSDDKKEKIKKDEKINIKKDDKLKPIEVKSDPESISKQHKLEGNDHYKNGRYEEALTSYNLAIEICPPSNMTELSTYYQNRAATHEQMKNWENVNSDCTMALSYNSKYVKALCRRAKACEILEDLNQSLEDLTAVCILESFSNESTLMTIDRLLKIIGKKDAKIELENKLPVTPSNLFIKSYFESFTQDPLTEECVEKVSVENGELPENSVHVNLYQEAKEYLKDYNLDKVISCCTTELSNPLSDQRPKCLLMRATVYILRGENKKAFLDLDELIDMPESDLPAKIAVNALIKRGLLHMQHEDVEKATEDLNTAAKLDPNNADVFHHKGQVLLLLNNVEEAIDDFKKAIELNSEYAVAIVQKSYTDFRYAMEMKNNDKIKDIKKDFENTIKKFPKCTDCYMLYAQVLSELNEFDKAKSLYATIEEIDPTNPNILVHKSMMVLQSEGDMEKSKELIYKAIELDDTCQLAYENLATIEVQLGNLKHGVELFNKAIKIAKTGMELTHLCALRAAAIAQVTVIDKMGIILPFIGSN